jgi:hypothetical protein
MTALDSPDTATPDAPVGDDAAKVRRARQRDWEVLTLSLIALVFSAILHVRDDGRVFFPGLAAHPLPESCMSRSLLGVKCPGCGLTRSFISLAHGHWGEAVSYHRVGWLVFLFAAVQVPYRLKRLYGKRPPDDPGPREGVGRWFGWLLLAVLVGNWVVGMMLGDWR